MKGHAAKLPRKQEAAIAALLSHRNTEEAANSIGVSPNTLLQGGKHFRPRREVLCVPRPVLVPQFCAYPHLCTALNYPLATLGVAGHRVPRRCFDRSHSMTSPSKH